MWRDSTGADLPGRQKESRERAVRRVRIYEIRRSFAIIVARLEVDCLEYRNGRMQQPFCLVLKGGMET